jgi:cell division protein FtsQ
LLVNKYKRFIYISVAISLVACLAYVLGWSSLLTVKKIEISGTNSISVIEGELQKKDLSLTVGMRLARVDLRGIKSTLSELDWLDSYSVERNWLAGDVQLAVIEKIGVAKALTQDGSTMYFDENGELFKPVSRIQLSKYDKLALVTSESRSSEDLAGVAALLQGLPTELEFLLIDLKGISAGKSGYLNMMTKIGGRDVQINWGKADSFEQKFQVLSALLKLPENKAANKFDLSIPDSPIAS